MTAELTIVKKDGGAYIDSRQVAEAIGKLHKHLIRDIRGYCVILERVIGTKIGLNDFFLESTYTDSIGRTLPCYLLTKMGCEMVASKLTGEKGVLFSYAYVRRFNEMEQAERDVLIANAATPKLSVFNNAVKNVLAGFARVRTSPANVMGFLRGAYKPFKINVDEWGTSDKPYSATEIARRIGICSHTGRPHGHAAAAIIDRLKLGNGHMECVPFGLVGIMMRYDEYTLNAVADWLEANDYPHDIPYMDFEYHIHYRRPNQNQLSLFDILDEPIRRTAGEPDAICGKYGGCDGCPGLRACGTREADSFDDEDDFFFDRNED
jgi:Rha family phage regulatory protein